MLSKLKTIPVTGDKVKHEKYEFEIIDMDGNRIDKIMMIQKFNTN